MNEQEFENALLLRESGELSDQDLNRLEIALRENPEWADKHKELQVLQQAGPFASEAFVPPVPERTMERIREESISGNPKMLPRILALAAGLVVAVALWPQLFPTTPQGISEISFTHTTGDASLLEDDLLDDLTQLQEEVTAWQESSATDLLQVEAQEFWAEQLITSEGPSS